MEEEYSDKFQVVGTASVKVRVSGTAEYICRCGWFAVAEGRRKVRQGTELEGGAGAKLQGAKLVPYTVD